MAPNNIPNQGETDNPFDNFLNTEGSHLLKDSEAPKPENQPNAEAEERSAYSEALNAISFAGLILQGIADTDGGSLTPRDFAIWQNLPNDQGEKLYDRVNYYLQRMHDEQYITSVLEKYQVSDNFPAELFTLKAFGTNKSVTKLAIEDVIAQVAELQRPYIWYGVSADYATKAKKQLNTDTHGELVLRQLADKLLKDFGKLPPEYSEFELAKAKQRVVSILVAQDIYSECIDDYYSSDAASRPYKPGENLGKEYTEGELVVERQKALALIEKVTDGTEILPDFSETVLKRLYRIDGYTHNLNSAHFSDTLFIVEWDDDQNNTHTAFVHNAQSYNNGTITTITYLNDLNKPEAISKVNDGTWEKAELPSNVDTLPDAINYIKEAEFKTPVREEIQLL